MDVYTKNGRLLQVARETVYARSGTVIGRIKDAKVYGPNDTSEPLPLIDSYTVPPTARA